MKRKLYYNIELRIGKLIDEHFGQNFYFSDGSVIISEGCIEGYLSNDLIIGELKDDEIFIAILNLEKGEEYKSFHYIFENLIEIPGKFYIPCNMPEFKNQYAIISFTEKINDIKKKEMIDKRINEVKIMHNYS